jgi:hypothetical protein
MCKGYSFLQLLMTFFINGLLVAINIQEKLVN